MTLSKNDTDELTDLFLVWLNRWSARKCDYPASERFTCMRDAFIAGYEACIDDVVGDRKIE